MPALTLFDAGAAGALAQVILIDIVLAGDNAVVIGMAASRVPQAQRRKVIFWGLAAAVVLRIGLATVTVSLLEVIGLTLAGGLLLLWVCWRFWRDLKSDASGQDASKTEAARWCGDPIRDRALVRRAVLQIVIADISMSLDNVLAVAGAALHHVWVLAVGLLLSIGLMGVAANFLARILQRHRWVSYLGLLIVLYVALSMIWSGSRDVLGAL